MKKKPDNRNQKKKNNLIRAGFLLLLAVSIYLAASILSIKSDHGVNQQQGLYWQPKNTVDVAMMGTSHVHCNINTALLWEKYGIAAYDYSGAEQPLWMTYHFLKELYKYQDPKVVVLDLFAPARFKEDYQYDWISENIYGMRFSLNKLQMLAVSVEPQKLHEYFPSFAVYHGRYGELEADDFQNFFWNSREKESFKGFTPYWKREPQKRPEISTESMDTSGDGMKGLTEKSEKYLRKIIAFMKNKEGKLVLIAAPYIMSGEDQIVYGRIAEIAAQEGIIFINYNEYYQEIGLDFEQDFNDSSHLNYWGSCKFTDYLGSFLASDDSIPDRRGQEGYASWEDNVQAVREQLASWGDSGN